MVLVRLRDRCSARSRSCPRVRSLGPFSGVNPHDPRDVPLVRRRRVRSPSRGRDDRVISGEVKSEPSSPRRERPSSQTDAEHSDDDYSEYTDHSEETRHLENRPEIAKYDIIRVLRGEDGTHVPHTKCGWFTVDDLHRYYFRITSSQLGRIVGRNEECIFEFRGTKQITHLRCTYGHLSTMEGLRFSKLYRDFPKPHRVPSRLFYRTTTHMAQRIVEEGLSPNKDPHFVYHFVDVDKVKDPGLLIQVSLDELYMYLDTDEAVLHDIYFIHVSHGLYITPGNSMGRIPGVCWVQDLV